MESLGMVSRKKTEASADFSSIAVLITSFNRVTVTLESLENLFAVELPLGTRISVFLVDDNSTDGTGASVKKQFPSINVIQGSGNLYWNGGMRVAWETASSTFDYDYYLWVNDDTSIHKHALTELLSISKAKGDKAIVCGATQSENDYSHTYGGKDETQRIIYPSEQPQEVYYLNGNIVLVPRSVYEQVGNLDKIYRHHLGDYDYGLRARKKGIASYTTTTYIGFCERNIAANNRARVEGSKLIKRMQKLYSPLGSNPVANFRYYFRHKGLRMAVKVFIYLHYINLLDDDKYLSFSKRKGRLIQ
jgi:GT2 family glycosyltransferase